MYAGEDGYDIHVGNGTPLEGAVLAQFQTQAQDLKAKQARLLNL